MHILQERDAFFKLAGYIGVGSAPKNVKVSDSGAADGKEGAQAMAMTAPVYMKEQSQAMAMTVPVYMGERCVTEAEHFRTKMLRCEMCSRSLSGT